MDIKGIIIHQLEKESGYNAKLTKAKTALKIKEVHEKFMTEVKDVYYKKSNPIYGVFDSAKDSFPYQVYLDSYLTEEITFYYFTVKAIAHFEKVINKISQATGGNVIFCHFKTTEDFLAVIMLNARGGYMVDENMDIAENFRLDIEKLDVANFSNCTKWNNNEDVYLSFTRGKKVVSNYFKEFIGCTDYTSAKESSEKLKRALMDFLLKTGVGKDEMEKIKNEVSIYCDKRMKTKEDISLSFISSIVNHDQPELFREFAATEEYQVSEAFKGHAILKNLKYYAYDSKDLKIVFDGKLLGKTVFFDNKTNQLLFKEVPEKLRNQLSRQQPAGDENDAQ